MRAQVKSLDLDPDPATLPGVPAEFALRAQMLVGTADGPGEESFDITVCTPEWLAQTCRKVGGIYNPRHNLVVDFEEFDKRALHAWLAARVGVRGLQSLSARLFTPSLQAHHAACACARIDKREAESLRL